MFRATVAKRLYDKKPFSSDEMFLHDTTLPFLDAGKDFWAVLAVAS
jgi:hypothetical protein